MQYLVSLQVCAKLSQQGHILYMESIGQLFPIVLCQEAIQQYL